MKRGFNICLTAGLTACILTGCTDKVDSLMKEEKYQEAYEEISKNPDKYESKVDEVTYHLAQDSVEEKNYQEALDYLEGNEFDGAQKLADQIRVDYAKAEADKKNYEHALELLENSKSDENKDLVSEITRKKTDQDFINTMAKALDARYIDQAEKEKEFNKEAYVSPRKLEYDAVIGFKDADFYDDELAKLANEYINAVEKHYKTVELWDTDLFKMSLKLIGTNAPRRYAIAQINGKWPLPLESDESKEYVKECNEDGDKILINMMYETIDYKEVDRYGDQVVYEATGVNTSDQMFKTPKEYDVSSIVSGRLLNRNGDIVGKVWDEGITTLRPGQSFTEQFYVDSSIGDLKDYFLE